MSYPRIPHLALPFRIVDGRAAVTEQDTFEEIRDCVQAIIRTPRGFRLELPDFGVPDQTFHEGGADADEIAAALDRWEPRVVVDDVRVDFSSAGRGELYIYLTYRRRDSNSPRNLVFPFYVIPARETEEPV